LAHILVVNNLEIFVKYDVQLVGTFSPLRQKFWTGDRNEFYVFENSLFSGKYDFLQAI